MLSINELPQKSNVGSNVDKNEIEMFNKLLISNENNNINNFYSAVQHKNKKFNYVCDINPTTLTNITGQLSNGSGQSIFGGKHNNGHIIYRMEIPNEEEIKLQETIKSKKE